MEKFVDFVTATVVLLLGCACVALWFHFLKSRYIDSKARKFLENLFGILGFVLLPVAYFLYATTFNANVESRNTWTVFWLCGLALGQIIMAVLPWMIAYSCGRNPALMTILRPVFYPEQMKPKADSALNFGVILMINVIVRILCFAVGAFFRAFPGITNQRVDYHVYYFGNLAESFTEKPLGFFVWVVIVLIFCLGLVAVAIAAYQAFQALDPAVTDTSKNLDIRRCAFTTFIIWIGLKLYSYWFLGFPLAMILKDLRFTVIVIFVILFLVWVLPKISVRITRMLRKSPSTP